MIGKEEIDAKAREYEISQTSVEKDYVFGWLLFGIFTISELKEIIFLKGGNVLRKGYFENTRYSSDLDFGIPNEMSQGYILNEINKICDFIETRTGVNFLNTDNRIEEKFSLGEEPIPNLKVYEVKIYFRDFYGMGGHIRLKIAMDITRYDKVLLPIQHVKLIHPYSDTNEVSCTICCMKLEEIIATKLKCLLQRQHAPDLFDYAYSIKLLGAELDKREVVETFVRKTIFAKNPRVLQAILHKTPFDYFRIVWLKTIVCAKTIAFQAEEAINLFIADLETLFSVYPHANHAQFAYFGSELRNPIMEAGRKQTLLRIKYNGSERLVEPYALKYMCRKDGQEREYLYVYNCTGGSNPPGQRSLVADGFQSIEVTDEKFEPRCPIELSKAGEAPENKYLFDINKPTKNPRSRRSTFRTKSHQIKYKYRCNVCGKKVSKTSMNNTLGAHKNKSGFNCGSRWGVYIGTSYS